jgi:hypothetical protein
MSITSRTIYARLAAASSASAVVEVAAAAPSAVGDSPLAFGPEAAEQAVPSPLTPAEAVAIAEAMGYGLTRHLRFVRDSGQPFYRVTVGRSGEVSLVLEIGAADGRIVYSDREDE